MSSLTILKDKTQRKVEIGIRRNLLKDKILFKEEEVFLMKINPYCRE
jgi:hypothetical protein